VRLIDAIMRAAERAERAEMLRAMSGGDLGLTLRDAADAGGLLDARSLLPAGADAGSVNGWALYNACLGDHIQVADVLLDSVGTLTREHRNIALIRAAYRGHTACCALMLDRGADINSRPYGVDALCSAAQHGHLETVALLLDRGADAGSAQALQLATEHGQDAVVALLLARRGGGAAQ
jgi:ankyrin repeat protein